MENQISFLPGDEFEQHTCEATREGEWLVFKCPLCNYLRRFNRNTGKMEVQPGAPDAMHQGQYKPVGIDFSTINVN